MGYYDKGSYARGSYAPLQERESARDRYLDLLARSRSSDQAMADKMRKEQEENERIDATNTNTAMLKGGQMGSAFGPYGALVGGIIGRAAGGKTSYDYRRQHGEGRGSAFFNAFLNPVQELKNLGNTLTGAGSGGGQSALAGMSNQVGRERDAEKRQKLAMQLEAQKQGYGDLEKSSYDSATDSEVDDMMANTDTSFDDADQANWSAEAQDLGISDEEMRQKKYYGSR